MITLSELNPTDELSNLNLLEQKAILGGWVVDVATNVDSRDYSRNATTYRGGHAALGSIRVLEFKAGSNPVINL